MTKVKTIGRREFDVACDALWSELQYQDNLPRRTDDEADDVPGFLTLGRRYMRKVEDAWADQAGTAPNGQVEDALHGLRKLSAIFLRAMIYNGIRKRQL